MTVRSVRRVGKKWDFEGVLTFNAKKGAELVVVALEIEALGAGKVTFKPSRWELLTTDGTKAESLIEDLSVPDMKPGAMRKVDLCFGVRRGLQVKTFRLNDVSFELETLDKAGPAPNTR